MTEWLNPKANSLFHCSSPKSQLGNPEILLWGKQNSAGWFEQKKLSKTKPDLVCWSFAKALLLHRAGLFRKPGRDQMLPDSSSWWHTDLRDRPQPSLAEIGVPWEGYLLPHFPMAARSSSEILSLLELLFPREQRLSHPLKKVIVYCKKKKKVGGKFRRYKNENHD